MTIRSVLFVLLLGFNLGANATEESVCLNKQINLETDNFCFYDVESFSSGYEVRITVKAPNGDRILDGGWYRLGNEMYKGANELISNESCVGLTEDELNFIEINNPNYLGCERPHEDQLENTCVRINRDDIRENYEQLSILDKDGKEIRKVAFFNNQSDSIKQLKQLEYLGACKADLSIKETRMFLSI